MKIGIWASSSPSPRDDLQKGLARLKKLGIEVVFPNLSRKAATKPLSTTQKFLAGSDAHKVEAFRELVADSSLGQILSVRGGYGVIRLLPLLDQVSLKRGHPKIWGYSDLTVLQHYLYSRTQSPWVHSPMLSSGSFHSPNTREEKYWKKILSDDSSDFEYKVKILHAPQGRGKSFAQHRGRILGGNLASLLTLMGTPWEPRFGRGDLLFLEEVSESPYRLERLLVQLSYHRDFGNLQGVVLGHFTDCPKSAAILKKWAEEKQIYLYGKISAGHERDNLPIVLGDVTILERKSDKDILLTLPKPVFGC